MEMVLFGVAGFGLILLVALVRQDEFYLDFCVGSAILVSLFLLGFLSFVTTLACPTTVDLLLRHIDLAIGLDGFALTRWLVRVDLYRFVPLLYSSLPLTFAAAWVLERSRRLLRAAVIGPIMALPFYFVVPAVGPQYAFSTWPASNSNSITPGLHPRNCFPSMHLCWAILIALNARSPWWRALAWAYAVLTAIVAVAGGEHYFIDLVVAVPFALFVQWAAKRPVEQREPRQTFSLSTTLLHPSPAVADAGGRRASPVRKSEGKEGVREA